MSTSRTYKKGRFRFARLIGGSYVFKVTFNGFQSLVGKLQIARTAKRNTAFTLAIQGRNARTRLGGNPLGSFADHLDIPDDGVLQLFGCHKHFFSRPDKPGDAAATLQHVVKVKPIIFHSGVASRRILSRTYQ